MVKDKAYMWIVFLMLLLLGLIGCSAAETPASVETRVTPAAALQDQPAKTVEVLLPAVSVPDAGSSSVVNVTGTTPEVVSIGQATAPGASIAQEDRTPADTTGVVIGMANPASVYCEEHGGRVDIRDSAAGQYGVCMFPDGQECDEWAFYRGECMLRTPGLVAPDLTPVPLVLPATPMATEPSVAPAFAGDAAPTMTEWVGTIVSMPAGGQYDDYFQMMDQDGTRAGISGRDDDIAKRLVELRDTGATVHVWGMLYKDIPDAYGMQIVVSRLETE